MLLKVLSIINTILQIHDAELQQQLRCIGYKSDLNKIFKIITVNAVLW